MGGKWKEPKEVRFNYMLFNGALLVIDSFGRAVPSSQQQFTKCTHKAADQGGPSSLSWSWHVEYENMKMIKIPSFTLRLDDFYDYSVTYMGWSTAGIIVNAFESTKMGVVYSNSYGSLICHLTFHCSNVLNSLSHTYLSRTVCMEVYKDVLFSCMCYLQYWTFIACSFDITQ